MGHYDRILHENCMTISFSNDWGRHDADRGRGKARAAAIECQDPTNTARDPFLSLLFLKMSAREKQPYHHDGYLRLEDTFVTSRCEFDVGFQG
jgi:hypothetical protein